MSKFTVAEFCVGGGGQALGLEAAGFGCVAAIEIDADCCTTLRLNRPQWNILQEDMRQVDGKRWSNVDLFAAGVPCPPFSIAGKQLGTDDDRDLFPEAIRIIGEMKPKAVMLENVPGFASAKFADYRDNLRMQRRLTASLQRKIHEEQFNGGSLSREFHTVDERKSEVSMKKIGLSCPTTTLPN